MKSMSVGQSTMYMTAASILQKVVSFAYFAFIARALGATDTGKYFFALSFTTIFVVFVDFGLTNVLVRESAKMLNRISDYVSSIISIKILLGIASYVVMAIVLFFFDAAPDTMILVYISGITMISDSLQLTLFGTLRALGNVKYEALSMVLGQCLTLILGTTFLYFHLPVYTLMFAFLVPSVINALCAFDIVSRKYRVKIKLKYSKKSLKILIPLALPFALATIFYRVFSYADSLIISKILGDAAVGWYSVPYKISTAFQFIPYALIAGLYPRMSEYFAHDKKRLNEVFNQALRYLLIVSVPIAVGIAALSDRIIPSFFGVEFSPAIIPLQILMCGLVCSFVAVVLGALLNASNKSTTQTMIVGISMVINIILNLFLIPRFEIAGAALASTIGNLAMIVISLFFVHRNVKVAYREHFLLLAKLLISGGSMSVFLWYTRGYLPLIILTLAGGLIFVSLFVLMKGVGAADRQYVGSMLSRSKIDSSV